MTTFLILCAAMVVAALALVLVPLLRDSPSAEQGATTLPRAVPAAVALMLAIPFGATLLYDNLSNFPWDNPSAVAAGAAGHAAGGGSLDDVTAKLQERLAANPTDVEGWRMLARTYLVTGRAADAVSAYEKAIALVETPDAGLQLDLAEAVVLAGDPAQQGRAKEIIDAALATDPVNQKALWYSGLMAVRADDTETAKSQWTKLLDTNPPEEIRQILVTQLEGLGVKVASAPAAGAQGPAMGGGMGGPMAGAGMGGAAGAPAGRTIRVAVSVDPALAAKVRPGTPVFVSARESGIPGPPLAAVRISTDELPTTVVLSDANAMVEGRNLSSVDDVQVVARVAFGGTAVTTSGDLVGDSHHRKGAPEDLSIVISKVAP